MNKSLSQLIEVINDQPEIKRLKSLETIIDSNLDILNEFEDLKQIQKKLVNAKYYKNKDLYNLLKEEYELKKESFSDVPLLDEYLELLQDAFNLLKTISDTIENSINKELL